MDVPRLVAARLSRWQPWPLVDGQVQREGVRKKSERERERYRLRDRKRL